MVEVVHAEALGGHKLRLRFSDGCEGVFDASQIVSASGEMVEPLGSADYFSRVSVENGAPTWPNGFDLDPINLYMELRAAGELVKNGWRLLPPRGGVVTSEMIYELLERADLEDAGLANDD